MDHQDIRDAVRSLCADFPDEYHRKIDQQRGYPEAFVGEVSAQAAHCVADVLVVHG